jgi:hypothetical protein
MRIGSMMFHTIYRGRLPEAANQFKKAAHCMTSNVDHLASRLNGDWRALLRARVNVLVTGPKTTLDAFVELCRDELREPIGFASPDGPLPMHPLRSLVIADVHRFDDVAQRELAEWLCDPDHAMTQVISLTSMPLFGLVDGGRFSRNLYYRLNMVHLQLAEANTLPFSHPRVA